MAYQTQGRDPLLDQGMQEALERRGRELLGVLLGALGLAAAVMILTYSPDDPNWMVATDAPVQNWLGRTGATVAAPLFMIVGWGALGIAAILLVWGARLALDIGRERAFGRVIFAPIAVALMAIYAATLAPPPAWGHSFGLGGLFGDTVLLMILQIVPWSAALGAKLMSLLAALSMLSLTAFVLGFTWAELRRLARWLVLGLVLLYAYALRALGRGAQFSYERSIAAAQSYQASRAARREEEAANDDLWAQHMGAVGAHDGAEAGASAEERARVAQVIRQKLAGQERAPAPAAMPAARPAAKPAPAAEKTGLRAFLPPLTRREPQASAAAMPEPELVTPLPLDADVAPTSEDRVRSKIAKAIRTRGREATDRTMTLAPEEAPVPFLRAEPQLTRGPVPTAPQAPFEIDASGETVFDDDDDDQAAAAAFAALEGEAPAIPVPEPKRVVQHAPKKTVKPSTRAQEEAQPKLAFAEDRPDYAHPPLSLLMNPDRVERHHLSDDALEENARMLENVLDDYGVKGDIVSVRPGPVVTMYELEPAPGLKASRVIGLADDIARSMSALSARVSTVPGRSVIGIELPNEKREMVALREILSGRDFGDTNMRLPLALGKDIGGDPIVANLAKMPHLLIAGTTGSGKSVAINTMILSLLYKLTPEECRLIMIDPKMLELSVYDGIPHLLSPVVTDPKKAVVALKWVVGEMEDRYRKMSKMGVRNIEGYNSRVADALSKDEMFTRTVQTGFDDDTGEPVWETEEMQPEKLPYIVVIVDEMADLMMVAGKEIEACIQRLAQMARASGIHLIMATQRPSVDVITGTIKANFPTRISFQVTSKVDSRTILGEQGAEQLLGMGDMLYMAGGAKITRVHGPFCSDEEVEEIVTYLKAYGPPDYVGGVVEGPAEEKESDIDLVLGLAGGIGGNTDGEDALYDQAVAIVVKDRKCSTSYIQRKLAIGYNKAARLVEQMEDEGVVSPANHVGKREILVPEQG
ncbi:MAG: DNA translocase FtsK 4TM domain-containing protein [Pseudomonadota bacterium]